MIKEKDFLIASQIFPLEYHIELIHYAFELAKHPIFEELTRTALIRCNYRRLEKPYIVDIDILPSHSEYPNIPNGYEKIPIDINEPSFRFELEKVRAKLGRNKIQKKSEPVLEKVDDKNKKAPGKPDPKKVGVKDAKGKEPVIDKKPPPEAIPDPTE